MKKRSKKHRKVSGVRRKRSSGLGGIDATNLLGVVAGAVAAGYLNKLVPPTVNDKLLAGGKVGLGVALPMLFKSGKMKNIAAGIGAGMVAVGSVDLLKSFGALSGDFDIPVINGESDELGADILSGDSDELGEDISVINGGDSDELGADFLGDDFLGEDED